MGIMPKWSRRAKRFSLLSMKSNRKASHAVWLPILIGSALALSKTKNCVVYLTTQHSPARSLNLHSLDTSLHHAVKSLVFCKLQSYRASSQEGLPCTDFSTPHRKILRPIKMVFDDILPARQVKQTRHSTYTADTRVHVSRHLIHEDSWPVM